MTDPTPDSTKHDPLNDIEYLELDDHTTLKAWLALTNHVVASAPQPSAIPLHLRADTTQIVVDAYDPATRNKAASINIEFNDGRLMIYLFQGTGVASRIIQLLPVTDGKVGP